MDFSSNNVSHQVSIHLPSVIDEDCEKKENFASARDYKLVTPTKQRYKQPDLMSQIMLDC